MHLHGQGFWVLGLGNGQITTPADALDPSKLQKLNTIDPPLRDTVAVPQAVGQMPPMEGMTHDPDPGGFGYAAVRFVAQNPGVWAFHWCAAG